MSVRELNANVSRVVARVEAGETIEIVKSGRVVGEFRPKAARRSDDPEWRAALDALMMEIDAGGLRFGRRFSHDERND